MTQNQQAGSLGKATPSNAVWGSDVMVDILRALGIKYIALNPGASYRGLHDSLVNYGDGGPEMLMCSHEEIAVAIANGYGRVMGKPMATGLHNVVGLQHAAMAIFNAWCDRTPILNLGGGGPQNTINRRSTDWVHTALVQGSLVRDFVKFDDQPYSVEASMESLLRAYRIATTAPMGPVYVTLDSDVQEERLEETAMIPDAANFRAPAAPRANLEALRDAAVMLSEAEWPVIVAGEISPHGTALGDLMELAELLGAPVIDTNRFSFPNTHELDATQVRAAALKDADVVLALDIPSLGVPLGPDVRERGALQPAISDDCKIINIGMFEFEKQSWVTDNMWLMPVANPIAADTTGALRELVIMCREMRAMGEDFSSKADARRAKVGAMHNEKADRQKVIGHAWPMYRTSRGVWCVLETCMRHLPVRGQDGELEAGAPEDVGIENSVFLSADRLARDGRRMQYVPLLCFDNASVWTVEETWPGQVRAASELHPDDWSDHDFGSIWTREMDLDYGVPDVDGLFEDAAAEEPTDDRAT